MTGGILAAAQYPYKDSPRNCSFDKNHIVGYVHKAFQFNFTDVNGNASFIKYDLILFPFSNNFKLF